MLANDGDRFRNVISGMGRMYGADPDDLVLDAYWIALSDWGFEDFQAAAQRLMKTSKFMPRPADFEDLRKSGRETAAEAWITARKHMVWGLHGYTLSADCPPLIAKIVHALGGANKIAMTNEGEIHFLERRFAQHFEELQDATDTREALPQIAVPTALHPRLAAGLKGLTSPRPALQAVKS
jgi:hypothetical protein